nr:hypothetical protein [uncultured Undibacterium sp.]
MNAGFCIDSLEEAIKECGSPVMFDTDQTSQFASDSFTDALFKNSIKISHVVDETRAVRHLKDLSLTYPITLSVS